MRKIYKMPRRDSAKAAAIAFALVALVLGGLVTHSRTAATGAVITEPAAAAQPQAPAPTVYFPSQYELHAGPPEPLPAQF